MEEKIQKWLYDIQSAICEIDSFFENHSREFNHYKNNRLLKRAIERDLEIIGEAVNRIIKIEPDFPIENAKRIVGLRNQIIHAYDSVSDESIWAIIVKHLPVLRKEINDLIKSI